MIILRGASCLLGLATALVASVGQAQSSPPVSALEGPADPVEASKLALAREIVAISFPTDQREQMFRQMLTAISSQMRASGSADATGDPEIDALVDRHIAKLPDRLMPLLDRYLPQMFEANAQAYTRHFTLVELTEIAAFARTKAGSRFLQSAPAVLSDPAVAAANQSYFREIQDFQKSFTEDLIADIERHLDRKAQTAS